MFILCYLVQLRVTVFPPLLTCKVILFSEDAICVSLKVKFVVLMTFTTILLSAFCFKKVLN
jgi:hypothetical protein